MWIESQNGILNSDYVVSVSSTIIINSEDERFAGREYAIVVKLYDGTLDIQRFGNNRIKADAAFRHYLNILTTNTG